MSSSWEYNWGRGNSSWRYRWWEDVDWWSEHDWREWESLRLRWSTAPVYLTRATMPTAAATEAVGQDRRRLHHSPLPWPWRAPYVQSDAIERTESGRSQRHADAATDGTEVESQLEPALAPQVFSREEADGGMAKPEGQMQTETIPLIDGSQGILDGRNVEAEIQAQTQPPLSAQSSRWGDLEHVGAEHAAADSPERFRGDSRPNAAMVDAAVQTEVTELFPPVHGPPRRAVLDVRMWSYD